VWRVEDARAGVSVTGEQMEVEGSSAQ
jgi:hypothetical protein